MDASRRASVVAVAVMTILSSVGALGRQSDVAAGLLWQFQTGG